MQCTTRCTVLLSIDTLILFRTFHHHCAPQVRRDWFVRGCVGVEVPWVCVSFDTSGFCLSVCLSVTSHFIDFPYAICVEGYLRGRHLLRSSCTLKVSTMKARVEWRHYIYYVVRCFACNEKNPVHRALINRYTHTRTVRKNTGALAFFRIPRGGCYVSESSTKIANHSYNVRTSVLIDYWTTQYVPTSNLTSNDKNCLACSYCISFRWDTTKSTIVAPAHSPLKAFLHDDENTPSRYSCGIGIRLCPILDETNPVGSCPVGSRR